MTAGTFVNHVLDNSCIGSLAFAIVKWLGWADHEPSGLKALAGSISRGVVQDRVLVLRIHVGMKAV